ncbi:hypothetical protein ACHAWT_003356 [Skeletonema menzelii]
MKTGNIINKILSSSSGGGGASAMLRSSSSSSSSSGSNSFDSESGGEDSSGGSFGSTSATNNNSTTKKPSKKQQRQRGSYASATASSKARGGPTSSAPRAKPASSMKATARPLPKKTNKENEANSTPIKAPQPPPSAQENVILSPTPYYKVLEERGGKTSPRLTRSAVKRAQTKLAMDSLAQLDNNNNNSDDDDEETKTPLPHGATATATGINNNDGFDSARISLQFQPPDRYEWQQQQQRRQNSKIRKSIQPSNHRTAKRTKYSSNNTEGEQMTSDQVRQIMTETLQSSNNDKLLQLSAEAASAKKEVEVTKLQLVELSSKYTALEECLKVKEGGESEVRAELVSCRVRVDNLTKELEVVKGEKQRLYDQVDQNGTDWAEEQKRMQTEHDDQLYQKELELQQVQKAQYDQQVQMKGTMSELEVVKAKLDDVTCQNQELEESCKNVNGSHSDLMERVAMLEREKADLMKVNCVNEGEIQSLKKELDRRQGDFDARLNEIQNEHEELLAQKDVMIQQLETDLDDANRTMEVMQSPKSREAMETTYSQEVEVMRTEMRGMKQLLKQMNETNDYLEVQLGQSRDENGLLVKQVHDLEGRIEEVKGPAAELKESRQQLEELVVENEQTLAKLEKKENELLQAVDDLEVQSKQLVDMKSKLNSVTSEKESLLSENESLATELNEVQDQMSQLQSHVGCLKDDLAKSQQQTESLFNQKNESDQKLHELSNQLQSLTTHLEAAQGTISSLEEKLRAKNEYCEQFEAIERKLICEKNVLNEIRRTLHNKVIQLSGNIRVYIRVRPLISSEQQLTARPSSSSGRPSSRGSIASAASSSQQQQQQHEECFHFPGLVDRKINGASKSPNYTSFSDLSKQTLQLTEPHRDRGGLNPRRKKWKYGFDKVFNPVNDQADVWEGAEPLVQSAVDGHKVCMFAYGQTSSGKTHTMIGDSVNRGLIPRAVEKLFASKKDIEHSFQGNVSVSIKVELLEIYNEEVFDLLDANAGPKGQKMKIKLNSNEAVNNVVVEASSQDEVQGVLELAQQRRCVKATKSNSESSRSHLLFTVRFELSSLTNEEMNREGVLHIVDLAGSERLDKSGSQGTLLTEAKHINTSLSALSHVIQKLQEKSDHIPYRDSKLTYLLRDSLGGDSKTLCIVCCSPHQAHFSESLNSIRFAVNASKVELKQGNKVDV